jgi:hypothetical protein
MANIFISHSIEDKERIRELAQRLRELNHAVFFASDSIPLGEKFRETISDELKSSEVIVAVISNNSAQSKWVMTEIGIALGYWEHTGKPLIIPLRIDDVPIPPQLLSIQVLDGRHGDFDRIALDISIGIENWIGRTKAKEDEKKETQARVEENATKYIQKSLLELRKRESIYSRNAYGCYIAALISLLVGVSFGIWRYTRFVSEDSNVYHVIVVFLSSLFVFGMLIALSRFSFLLGKSFMVESLRNSDRIHAISFGEFYLNAFGSKADWLQIKDAFQHWNIDKGSFFYEQKPGDYDPHFLRSVENIVKGVISKGKESKKED